MLDAQKLVDFGGVSKVVSPVGITEQRSALLSPAALIIAVCTTALIIALFSIASWARLPKKASVPVIQPSLSGADGACFFSALLRVSCASRSGVNDGR